MKVKTNIKAGQVNVVGNAIGAIGSGNGIINFIDDSFRVS
jgi:hypothetical protein